MAPAGVPVVPYVIEDDTPGTQVLYYVTQSPGQDPTVVTESQNASAEQMVNPVQSPDFATIVYNDQDASFVPELDIINLDGTGRTVLETNTNGGFPNTFGFWKPDGSNILWIANNGQSNERGDLYRVNPDGSGRTLIVAAPAGLDTGWYRPQYNRDGTKIAVALLTQLGDGDLYVMDADGSNQVVVASGIGVRTFGSQWGWANTQDVLAYADTIVGGVWRVDADGTNQSQISTSSSSDCWIGKFCWSADDVDVFGSVPGVTSGIARIPADGSGESALASGTPSLGNQEPPLVFGDRLYYFRQVAGTVTALVSVALDGSEWRTEHTLSATQFVGSLEGMEVS